MSDLEGVTSYLATHQLEEILSDAVARCVDDAVPQPLARIAKDCAQQAAERVLDFDYVALVTELTALIHEHQCGPLLLRLSWHDAGMYCEALGDGAANAALRFTNEGEGALDVNRGLSKAVSLLAPLQAKHRNVGHADLWALAANVAIEVMGGPRICTRFGRLDAASALEGVNSSQGRLPDWQKDADHLRSVFWPKSFSDRDIVAFCGMHTVGSCDVASSGFEGSWTAEPMAFDNSYFVDLLGKRWRPFTVPGMETRQLM